jgi:hypothetical protein
MSILALSSALWTVTGRVRVTFSRPPTRVAARILSDGLAARIPSGLRLASSVRLSSIAVFSRTGLPVEKSLQ